MNLFWQLGAMAHKQLQFILSSSNPTLPGLGECELIMQDDGITCDAWIRRGSGGEVFYRTANNALLDNWTSEVTCTGIKLGYFPTVFKIGSTYYMLHRAFSDNNMYLYSSTDKLAWTVLNGDSPVITKSSNPESWFNTIYNTAIFVIGTQMHILCEGNAASGEYSFPSALGYATASLANPVFTLPETPTIRSGACPVMIHSTKYNAVAIIYSEFNDYSNHSLGLYMSETRCRTVSLNSDLNNPTSWKTSAQRFPEFNENPTVHNQWAADFSIVFTPEKTYPTALFYCHNQTTGYQAYANDINNEDDLYNAIKYAE